MRPAVLWIDDQISTGDQSVANLQALGFDVICVQTGAESVEAALRRPFDAILLDLGLKNESGLDVLDSLVSAPINAPVIVLTAFVEVESIVAAMKLGAVNVQVKSSNVQDLASAIRSAFARDGIPRPSRGMNCQSERNWLEAKSRQLPDSNNESEIVATLLTILPDQRLPLTSFFACAAAFRMATRSNEPSVGPVAARVFAILRAASSAPLPGHPKLRTALEELEKQAGARPRLFGATAAGLSRAYFSHLLTVQTGRTPSEWRRGAVMQAAVRRLLRTQENVSQIAFALGYEHVSQFDRDFVGTFGVSPTRIRRLHDEMGPRETA
jgi:DNA-binding response OmpR family regulator/AraC-like DNA-binding protein